MKKSPYDISDIGISIGDVSKICKVPVHTIRYWEKEFSNEFLPARTKGKQRRYTDKNIETLMLIKKILWEDNFSIKGARKILEGDKIISTLAPTLKIRTNNTDDIAMQIASLIKNHLLMQKPSTSVA